MSLRARIGQTHGELPYFLECKISARVALLRDEEQVALLFYDLRKHRDFLATSDLRNQCGNNIILDAQKRVAQESALAGFVRSSSEDALKTCTAPKKIEIRNDLKLTCVVSRIRAPDSRTRLFTFNSERRRKREQYGAISIDCCTQGELLDRNTKCFVRRFLKKLPQMRGRVHRGLFSPGTD